MHFFLLQFASPFIPKIITVLPDFHRGLVSQPLQIPKSATAEWKVLVTQSCLTLHEPIDCSLPGSSVYGILQARIPEWRAIPFSWGSSRPTDWTQVSCIVGGFFLLFFSDLSLYWAYTIWHSISIQSMCILSYTLNYVYITGNA